MPDTVDERPEHLIVALGKFIGSSGFCWVAQRAGIGGALKGILWFHLLGVAWLAGIGFTMSFCKGQPAFEHQGFVEQVKSGI